MNDQSHAFAVARESGLPSPGPWARLAARPAREPIPGLFRALPLAFAASLVLWLAGYETVVALLAR